MPSTETFVDLQQLMDTLDYGTIASLISSIPSAMISLAIYIVTALSVYTLAQRRGLKHPWLAWIPVARMWTLGAIADDYRLKAKGERRSRRKVLLGLKIATTILSAVVMVLCVAVLAILFAAIFVGVGSAMTGNSLENLEFTEEMQNVLGVCGVGFLLTAFPTVVLSILHAVFYYIALYDLYCSCEPGNAVLYLVLSIFVGLSQPVFLFLCRNKDDGLPKSQPETPPVAWAPPAPVAEPWNDPTQL